MNPFAYELYSIQTPLQNPPLNRTGKLRTVLLCLAPLSVFALGATLGCIHIRRLFRRRHRPAPPSPPPTPPSHGDEYPFGALYCPSCFKEFQLPRVATCGHTICTECLAVFFMENSRPPCPVCGKVIWLSLAELPPNLVANRLVDERAPAWMGRPVTEWTLTDTQFRVLTERLEHAQRAAGKRGIPRTMLSLWKWSIVIAYFIENRNDDSY